MTGKTHADYIGKLEPMSDWEDVNDALAKLVDDEPPRGMTYSRYRDIAQIDKDGSLGSVSPAEVAEYREFTTRMKTLLSSISTEVRKNFKTGSSSENLPLNFRKPASEQHPIEPVSNEADADLKIAIPPR